MSNILIRGCPGTGKTFQARAVAYYMCVHDMNAQDAFLQNPADDLESIEKFINDGSNCEFIQVHPSMEFDDIVYGLEIRAKCGFSITYTEKRVMALCKKAQCGTEKFCIILDDINRANAKQSFRKFALCDGI